MASKQSGPGCIILFGLIFVVAGCIPGCIALQDLHTASATRGWVQTSAALVHVELHHGEDTVSVEARYRYRAPDPAALEAGALKDYEGTQVGIHSGSDNVGGWQLETYARLDQAWKAEETVPCWYDPHDPARAVLDREERWELIGFMFIFPLVFGLVGSGIAWLGIRQWRASRQPASDPQVAARQAVIPADGGGACGMWVAAVIWNTISWVAVVAVVFKSGVPTFILVMLSIFPLIGLGLLWAATQASLRRLRHGRPQLRLDGGVWNTGTRVQATILTRTEPQAGDRIEARLVVVRRVTTGSGKESSTTERTLWSLDLTVDPQSGRAEAGAWASPVELPLPGDVPATAEDVTWRLEWQVVRPGPDLSVVFKLPVAAGADDGALRALDLTVAADRAAPLTVLHKAGVRIADDGGSVVIALPAFRNPSLYLTGVISTLILSMLAAAAWHEVGWWTGLLSLPILGLCWRGALRSALWRSTITISRGRIQVRAGWWRMTEHDLRGADIMEVERKSSMTSGETAWFNMWLRTADGQRVAIVRGVPGPAAARISEMIDSVRR